MYVITLEGRRLSLLARATLEPALRARFLLYVALPVGSWLGGALVERLIEAALGP